ncbi:hypothetical protein [Nocardioides fonticola]|uniref:hypothetical protein n=1 Tax=Nocardioides fonticola TaxID=450363 RepID=UPI0031D68E15
MTCPRCGGARRRPIGPNWFACESDVVQGLEPLDPRFPNGPARPVTGLCGHRYQDDAAVTGLPLCACHIFAVGVCSECASPLCGDHLRRDDDGIAICEACEAAREARRLEEERQARLAELAEAPPLTFDLLQQLVHGRAAATRVVLQELRVTGEQAVGLFRYRQTHAVPLGGKEHVRVTMWRTETREVIADGWVLAEDPHGPTYPRRNLYHLLTDGRIVIESDWVASSSGWSSTKRVLPPTSVVPWAVLHAALERELSAVEFVLPPRLV